MGFRAQPLPHLAISFLGLVLVCGPAAAAHGSDEPRVVISSRTPAGDSMHVVGFLEGLDLKSAGIYEHGEKVKDISVSDVRGSQRVNFDLKMPSLTAATIQVTDAMGRSASAVIMPESAMIPSRPVEPPAAPSESIEESPPMNLPATPPKSRVTAGA